MKLPLFLVGAILVQGLGVAGTNGATPVQTNFVSGATLSGSDLDEVVQLANLCGVTNVTGVSTDRRLNGVSIAVRGDEKIDGRTVLFKTLLVRRVGWPGGKLPNNATRSIGEFWVEASSRPQEDERTIVRVGDRTLWVGLLNGIKPEGADKVIDAFVKGRIRFGADTMRDALSGIDVTQPRWIGISGGKLWITFSSPHTRIIFTLRENEVTVLDKVQMYE